MCYQADSSLFLMKSSACYCSDWNLIAFEDALDCKVVCKDSSKYCGTNEMAAVYSVCGKFSWGPGCQMNCMCDSGFCDIVEGKCTTDRCMPGFRGERCDWWDETLVKGLWSLTIRSYLKEALDLGIIGNTEGFLNPIAMNCSAGLYGRACTMRCHCINSSKCIQTTGICSPGGCQLGWAGRRCDRVAPCDPSKCMNGGKCTMTSPSTYICQCQQPFIGVHCEYNNPCKSSPCDNEGSCFNIGPLFKCYCTYKFTGEFCQIAIPDSWSVNILTQMDGCYRNLLNDAMNLRTYIDRDIMNKDKCVTFCRGRSYMFAGIERGNECYCTNMLFNQFGAVWLLECNSKCAGNSSISPSFVSECGGEGLITVYTTCPINTWGESCVDICMCAVGQCDMQSGLCRRPNICQFGWSGSRCDSSD